MLNTFCRRLLTAMLLASVFSGCQTVGKTLSGLNPLAASDSSMQSPPEKERERWWDANRDRAEFVPGEGFRIEGVAGYFDEKGRPIKGPIQQASYEATIVDDKDASSESILDRLDPAVTVDKLKKAFGQGPDEARAKELLAEGETLFQQRQFEDATSKFEKAARRWPATALAENARFMQAESLFFADEYAESNDVYSELIKDFSKTRHLDKVLARLFDIARYWQQMHEANPQWMVTPNILDDTRPGFDTMGHAIRTYDNIRLSDPTGPLADSALMATATAYFAQGRYDDADYHFDLLRREYPKSEHQYQAHLLGLQCKLRRYQGADYDGAVLEEADHVANQLLKQFPTQLNSSEERQRIEQLRSEIAAQRALRDWNMAEFYANRKQFRAARIYWQGLIKKYPNTKLAERAQARLTETQAEPAEPPVPLKWLADMFSKDDSSAVESQPTESDKRR